eukprot:scaffold6708_cov134-Cylindrotheca_fusiformis.AAC.26
MAFPRMSVPSCAPPPKVQETPKSYLGPEAAELANNLSLLLNQIWWTFCVASIDRKNSILLLEWRELRSVALVQVDQVSGIPVTFRYPNSST